MNKVLYKPVQVVHVKMHIRISLTQLKNHAQWLSHFDSMFHASEIGLGRYAQKDDWS